MNAFPMIQPRHPSRLLVSDIQDRVASFYGIHPREMVSARRARAIARPRQVAMYLTKEFTDKSLPAIGGLFGKRDHTTVIHAIRQVDRLCTEDIAFRRDVQILRERLTR